PNKCSVHLKVQVETRKKPPQQTTPARDRTVRMPELAYVYVAINLSARSVESLFCCQPSGQLRGQWSCSAVGVIDATQMKGRTHKEYINVII
ncbi:MAG: hypothetical protein VYD18_04950, partial [Candidatus Latescibacterota bacterium]|nr:hypothetical protein [Candidatus Latescibacterota bacterium]